MTSLRKKALQRLLAAGTLAFASLMRRLPFACARRIGRLAGYLAYYVVPRIRRVGLANVALALGPDTARSDGRRLVRAAAGNVGTVAAEFAFTDCLRDRRFRERHVDFEGIERLPEGGCVVIGAHLGNWEWMAPAIAQHGVVLAEVVRPLDDPLLNAFVDRTRRSGGIDTIPKANAGREILRRLRDGQKIGIMVDQSPRESAMPVSFFGQPCWATAAPAMAALLANVPIHPVSMVRTQGGSYRVTIGPALPLVRSGNKRDDLLAFTQLCQQAAEDLIRAHPGQWLWFHRRWKERPRLERQWNQRQTGES